MLKIEIEMDDEKIAEFGYKALDAYLWIRNRFLTKKFIDISPNDKVIVFRDKGSEEDMLLLYIAMQLFKEEWFRKSVKKAIWYNSDDGRNEDDFSIEDVKQHVFQNSSWLI